MKLRPYQEEFVDNIRASFYGGKRAVLGVAPTGSGKTVCFSDLARRVTEKGKRITILTHREELLDQVSDTLEVFGVKHEVLAAGRYPKYDTNVLVASVFTLVRRKNVPLPDLLIIDEAHHAIGKSTWGKVVKTCRRSLILGVTATPTRMSGEGMNELFDDMVLGPTTAELIESGDLSDYRLFAPTTIDTSGLHKRGGDYAKKELAERTDKRVITGSSISHYKKHAEGMPAVAFCVSIDHARHVAEEFRTAGYRALAIDGKMDKSLRREAIRDFKRGQIQVLTSCDLISEGFDCPGIVVGILLRPTQSTGLYLQQCLDSKTEILTDDGWKRYKEIDISDSCAAFDSSNGVIRWLDIDEIFERELGPDEEMYSISAPHLDIRVTAGHDMIVKGGSGTSINWNKQTAEQTASRRALFKIPVSGVIDVKDYSEITDAELRFLGWFLSDGTRNKTTNTISISQSAGKPAHCKNIREVIAACGFKHGECRVKRTGEYAHCADSIMFSVSKGKPRGEGKHLTGWEKLLPWIDKSIPAIYDNISVRQLSVLLETLNLGDGSNQHNPSWTRRTMSITFGDNERMADRFQALCVVRGFRCNKAVYHKNEHGPWYSLYIKPLEYSTIAGTNVPDGSVSKKKPYSRSRFSISTVINKEKVWCVTNKLGSLIIRRNGKVAIVGNCGRCLRTAPGKDKAIILDHAGNSAMHGLPDEDRKWTLEGRGCASDSPGVKNCPKCFYVMASHKTLCPDCGYRFVAGQGDARVVEQVEGELQETEYQIIMQKREQARARRNKGFVQAQTKTLKDLEELGRKRGYKNPSGWARHIFDARLKKRNAA